MKMSINDSDELDSLSSDDTSDEERIRAKIRRKLRKMNKEKIFRLSEKLEKKVARNSEDGIDQKSKTNFKRANKNRPREVSSKKKPDFVVAKAKAQKPRDPRFDPLSGDFDKSEFKSNYGFVSDIWKTEVKQLKEALKTCTSPAEKKKMQLVLQRLENKVRENEKEKHQRQERIEEKLQQKEQIRQGHKPFYKKKSEKKLENLVKQYEDLRQGNKLEKHIKKRSKKLAVKERKKLFE